MTGTPFLPSLLLRAWAVGATEHARPATTYRADARVLFGIFRFRLEGSIDEQIDRAAGRYRIIAAGREAEAVNRLESAGFIRARRFTPTETHVFLNLRGRVSRTAIAYDYDRRLIDYSHVSHTFFLGHRREVHDRVRPDPDQHVDDVVTVALNYAQESLPRDATGTFRTYVVRRSRPTGEEPDEVEAGGYRAEIVPLVLKVVSDDTAGRSVALLDLAPLSSWAHADRPARIVFGPDRRPESIDADLILGSRVQITFEST